LFQFADSVFIEAARSSKKNARRTLFGNNNESAKQNHYVFPAVEAGEAKLNKEM
jgi:hypothetical protein